MYSWINKELSWGNYTPPVRISARLMAQETRQENGLKMLWTDLTSLIPTEELLAWYLEMLAVNPDMRSMVERLQEKTTETIRDQLHTCEKYLFYRCHFINAGIDLVFIETETCNLWSWEDCNIYKRDSCE